MDTNLILLFVCIGFIYSLSIPKNPNEIYDGFGKVKKKRST